MADTVSAPASMPPVFASPREAAAWLANQSSGRTVEPALRAKKPDPKSFEIEFLPDFMGKTREMVVPVKNTKGLKLSVTGKIVGFPASTRSNTDVDIVVSAPRPKPATAAPADAPAPAVVAASAAGLVDEDDEILQISVLARDGPKPNKDGPPPNYVALELAKGQRISLDLPTWGPPQDALEAAFLRPGRGKAFVVRIAASFWKTKENERVSSFTLQTTVPDGVVPTWDPVPRPLSEIYAQMAKVCVSADEFMPREVAEPQAFSIPLNTDGDGVEVVDSFRSRLQIVSSTQARIDIPDAKQPNAKWLCEGSGLTKAVILRQTSPTQWTPTTVTIPWSSFGNNFVYLRPPPPLPGAPPPPSVPGHHLRGILTFVYNPNKPVSLEAARLIREGYADVLSIDRSDTFVIPDMYATLNSMAGDEVYNVSSLVGGKVQTSTEAQPFAEQHGKLPLVWCVNQSPVPDIEQLDVPKDVLDYYRLVSPAGAAYFKAVRGLQGAGVPPVYAVLKHEHYAISKEGVDRARLEEKQAARRAQAAADAAAVPEAGARKRKRALLDEADDDDDGAGAPVEASTMAEPPKKRSKGVKTEDK